MSFIIQKAPVLINRTAASLQWNNGQEHEQRAYDGGKIRLYQIFLKHSTLIMTNQYIGHNEKWLSCLKTVKLYLSACLLHSHKHQLTCFPFCPATEKRGLLVMSGIDITM